MCECIFHQVYMLSWPKSSFRFFCKVSQKNPNEFLGQPHIITNRNPRSVWTSSITAPAHVLFLFQSLMQDATLQLVSPQPSVPPGCDGFPDVSHLVDLDNLEEFRSGIFAGCPLIGVCLMFFFIIRCLVCKKSRVPLFSILQPFWDLSPPLAPPCQEMSYCGV